MNALVVCHPVCIELIDFNVPEGSNLLRLKYKPRLMV